MNLREGEKQVNNYTFNVNSDMLGKGAFSKVYLAKNKLNGEQSAIKIVSIQKLREQNLFSLLQNEIQAMKMVSHPNIVQIHGVLNTQNNVYIIMEYCDGGDVGDILKAKKNLSEEVSIKILKDILRGYKELLSKGIIHRDLKPDNFFISKGVYKLGDFGFAQFVRTKDQKITTTFIGTPLYMSPQCLKSEYYSSKCDIWSLGLSFYQMLVGSAPWKCETHIELVKSIHTKPITIPFNVMITAATQEVLKKCLEIPEERRISWDELYQLPIFRENFNEVDNELTISSKSDERLISFEVNLEEKSETTDIQRVRLFNGFIDKTLNLINECMIMNEISPFLLEKIRILLYKDKMDFLMNHSRSIMDRDAQLRSSKITYDSYLNLIKHNSLTNNEALDLEFEDVVNQENLYVNPHFYEKSLRLIIQAIRQINHMVFNEFTKTLSLSQKSQTLTHLLDALLTMHEIIKEKLRSPHSINYLQIETDNLERRSMNVTEKFLNLRETVYSLNL